MKKISIISTIAPALTMFVLLTGCLKDKNLEDQRYGTVIREVKAVSFPAGLPNPFTIGIPSQSTPLEVKGPRIFVEADGPALTNINISLEENNTLVTDAGLTVLPAGSYAIKTLTPVITAGHTSCDSIVIVFNNSAALDPTVTYGIGLNIKNADNGYKVAANQRTMVISLSIKNRFDGVYSLRMGLTGWAAYSIADGVSGAFPGEIRLLTASGNSTTMYSTSRSSDLQPGFTGGTGFIDGSTSFGAAAPEYVFDLATNKLIGVVNTLPDDGRGRGFGLNPAVSDSRFDPATRTIYAAYYMKQNGRPNMYIYDTLTFLRDR
ncbi:MAG: hypothetical protein DI535_24995 [Citrobacter freundii]|nr:MAG: hypothetical protein DI535_24995 [Citrobacter freundii]